MCVAFRFSERLGCVWLSPLQAATAQRDEGAGCHGATPGQIEGVKSNVDRQHLLFATPSVATTRSSEGIPY